MNEKIVKKINELEVLSDTITATLEYYDKLEMHFNEPIESSKLKIFIKNSNEKLTQIINNLYEIINK